MRTGHFSSAFSIYLSFQTITTHANERPKAVFSTFRKLCPQQQRRLSWDENSFGLDYSYRLFYCVTDSRILAFQESPTQVLSAFRKQWRWWVYWWLYNFIISLFILQHTTTWYILTARLLLHSKLSCAALKIYTFQDNGFSISTSMPFMYRFFLLLLFYHFSFQIWKFIIKIFVYWYKNNYWEHESKLLSSIKYNFKISQQTAKESVHCNVYCENVKIIHFNIYINYTFELGVILTTDNINKVIKI